MSLVLETTEFSTLHAGDFLGEPIKGLLRSASDCSKFQTSVRPRDAAPANHPRNIVPSHDSHSTSADRIKQSHAAPRRKRARVEAPITPMKAPITSMKAPITSMKAPELHLSRSSAVLGREEALRYNALLLEAECAVPLSSREIIARTDEEIEELHRKSVARKRRNIDLQAKVALKNPALRAFFAQCLENRRLVREQVAQNKRHQKHLEQHNRGLPSNVYVHEDTGGDTMSTTTTEELNAWHRESSARTLHLEKSRARRLHQKVLERLPVSETRHLLVPASNSTKRRKATRVQERISQICTRHSTKFDALVDSSSSNSVCDREPTLLRQRVTVKRTCLVDDCDNYQFGKSLCREHWTLAEAMECANSQ